MLAGNASVERIRTATERPGLGQGDTVLLIRVILHQSPDFSLVLPGKGNRQTGEADIQNVVYRNGALWAVHTVFLPAGGSPTRSAIQWWVLTTTGAILQRGRIDDATGNTFYAFPSIAVNKNNDVLIGYPRFSAIQYAGANYSFRAASDPPNTLQADTVLKAGEASYYKTFGGTKNRWGDYSNTVVDPVNDTDMWTIQEYAATPSGGFDRWGTWWGRVTTTPTLSVSPTSLDFGKVAVGSSKDLSFTVTNVGVGTLAGTVTASFPFSITTGSSFSLETGASQTVTVRFSPSSTGTFTGTATVSSNGGIANVTLSGAGEALVPGGGDPATDCFAEWLIENPFSTLAPWVCADGDPTCDSDTVTGQCTFQVTLCFNNLDPELSACSPTDVAYVTLRNPNPLNPKDTADTTNVMAIEEALVALGGVVVESFVVFSPALTDIGTCTEFGFAVPFKSTAAGSQTGIRVLKVEASSSGGSTDADSLKLICLPSS